jgi:hypothetical protein
MTDIMNYAGLRDATLIFAGDMLDARKTPPRPSEDVIIFSSAISAEQTGDARHNGGLKLYNDYAKLLCRHGYEAYVCTFDGEYTSWLIEHAPHCSLDQVREWQEAGRHIKPVTGWIASTAFLETFEKFYFFDAEIAYTAGRYAALLTKLMPRILRIATNARHQQVWYMIEHGVTPTLLVNAIDDCYWYPSPSRRVPGRVGYMVEGPDTESQIEQIKALCDLPGVGLEFVRISGDEQQVLREMQSCDIFLGMNPGKHPLWGEACPCSQQEALHAGCVVIAFDVGGNREYIIPGFSGYLVPRGDVELMAGHLGLLIALSERLTNKEWMRTATAGLMESAFTLESRWPALREWLEL